MSTTVSVHIEPPVARVRFASERGVQLLSAEVRDVLECRVDELSLRDDVSVVVFEAEGPTFLAGADITELSRLDPETGLQDSLKGQRLMNHIAALDATTICAIHAACAGGGCELALACDLRLAAERAKIGLPETSIGIIPGWGGTVRVTRLLGGSVARRMILTGELLPAAEALRIGLVDAVFPDAEFRSGVETWIKRILTRAPSARRRAKRLIRRLEAMPLAGTAEPRAPVASDSVPAAPASDASASGAVAAAFGAAAAAAASGTSAASRSSAAAAGAAAIPDGEAAGPIPADVIQQAELQAALWWQAAFAAEAAAFADCYRTDEPHEGQTAFLEKRPSSWSPKD